MITIMLPDAFIERFSHHAGRAMPAAAGTFLFHRNDPVRSVFLVTAGKVVLQRPRIDGGMLVLQHATAGHVVAESSIFSDIYHCDARVTQNATCHVLRKMDFLHLLSADAEFATLWMTWLAGQIQTARLRAEILAQKTVAARLNGWLDWHDGSLPPRGEWKRLAAEIAVTPEALYRELARRGLNRS